MTFVRTELDLTERFIRGLENYDLTADEIKNWTYVGGGHTTNRELHKILDQKFKVNFPTSDPIELEDTCVCGHPIQQNAFISDGERILVLGSCCVKRFLTTGTKKTCRKCKKPYRGCYLECKSCRPYNNPDKVCKRCGCVYQYKCRGC
jgi:hypothetical protein